MWMIFGCCTELMICTSRRMRTRSASVSILHFFMVLMATSWPVSLLMPSCTLPYVPWPSFLIMSNLCVYFVMNLNSKKFDWIICGNYLFIRTFVAAFSDGCSFSATQYCWCHSWCCRSKQVEHSSVAGRPGRCRLSPYWGCECGTHIFVNYIEIQIKTFICFL